jgi:hypothetical protein
MDIRELTNEGRQYSLFAILTPDEAKQAEQALLAEGFTQGDMMTCYQGAEDARAFLERHQGFMGVLRKMFVGHQVDVDKRYAHAARAGNCVLQVHIGQERSAARDRAEIILLEAGGRDVYFFGEASYRDVSKNKQQAARQRTIHPGTSG